MSRTSTKERQSKRLLSDDELPAVWKATTEHGTFGALIRFLLLTAARRDEARLMTWQEIKGSDLSACQGVLEDEAGANPAVIEGGARRSKYTAAQVGLCVRGPQWCDQQPWWTQGKVR